MRVRHGPAAVRGDAPPPRRHWPAGREGGGGGSPESEDLPLAPTPFPSRKEETCSTVPSQPSWLSCSPSSSPPAAGTTTRRRPPPRRRPRSRPHGRRRSPSRSRPTTARVMLEEEPDAIVSLSADRHRVALRDRRRRAGDRGRRPVRLPGGGAGHRSLRLPAERRGDRRLRARPRRRRLRSRRPGRRPRDSSTSPFSSRTLPRTSTARTSRSRRSAPPQVTSTGREDGRRVDAGRDRGAGRLGSGRRGRAPSTTSSAPTSSRRPPRRSSAASTSSSGS